MDLAHSAGEERLGEEGTSGEDVREENRRLRRTMRDLVALSALPAVWTGLGVEGIASSLARALFDTLSLDLVYIQLIGANGEDVIEVARSRHGDEAGQLAAIKEAVGPLLEADWTQSSTSIPDPVGSGTLQIAVTRFGVSDDYGLLVTGARRADFPSEQDRLLLGVGANQTAILLQRRRSEERFRSQQEWLRVTLANIADAVIAVDTQGHVALVNGAAEELTGWRQEQALGKPLESVFTVVGRQTSWSAETPLEKVLKDEPGLAPGAGTMLLARDGTERPIDTRVTPIRDGQGKWIGSVVTFRDITSQWQIEQQRMARLAVTHALNQASTVREGAASVLQAICQSIGWDVGFFWTVDPEGSALSCLESWYNPDQSIAGFEAASCSHTFEKGQGLPGRTWASGKPTWIPELADDANFPRLVAARNCGLHSAFACPIVGGEQTLGVMEFFTRRVQKPDAGLLEMMGTIAGNVAQFIERKTAEEELRISERELADFFENATIGLHWVGPDGTILRANRAELEMLGYSREEYIGHPISEFHVDDDVICEILKRLKAGEKLEQYPARMRCKDGSIKDVLIDSSVLWREGRFIHTRCFTRDVTERKRAETALADARSRLDAALEAGAIATWTWDIINNRLFADSDLARLFNLGPADAGGALVDRYMQSIHVDDLARVCEALKRSAETGCDYEADYRILQPDGSLRWVTARGRAVCDAAGRPVCMPGVLVDITDRKRLEEELRETDRRKDEFLAMLAHELRNPLAPIRNALQILNLPGLNSDTAQQTRDMMERQVQHLVRLVDDLLDVSRVTRSKIELRKEPLELASVIAHAVEIAQPLIEAQRHRLTVTLPPDALILDGDPVRLAQVVGNLLTNAAKYTEPGGRIEVSAERADAQAILRVRDTGIGIAPHVLPRVFDLFVQVDQAATRSQGGLGIGLTLVKNLVEMHGGTIEAHSPGLGQGSEFTVRLPLASGERPEPCLAKARQDDRAAAGEQPQPRSAARGHRVLVVDDNKDAAVSLGIVLRAQGHDVQVVHDGLSALERLKSFYPAVIFLDIGMPGMDGHEVARRIRQLPGLEKVVLVALTGWGQQEDRQRTAAAGFDHHLVKPPELSVVTNLLAGLEHSD